MRFDFLAGQQQTLTERHYPSWADTTGEVGSPQGRTSKKKRQKGPWSCSAGRQQALARLCDDLLRCTTSRACRLLGLHSICLLPTINHFFIWSLLLLSTEMLFTQLQFSSSALFFFSCNSSNVTSLPLLWALLTHPSNAHSEFVTKCLLTGMAAPGPQLQRML